MRLNSISDNPSSTDARRRVYVFELLRFHGGLPYAGSRTNGVFFNRQDHGLVDIHVPAIANPHPYGFPAILQQFSREAAP